MIFMVFLSVNYKINKRYLYVAFMLKLTHDLYKYLISKKTIEIITIEIVYKKR